MTEPVPPRVPARTLWVGCGRLGRRAGAALVDGGGEVLALRRDPHAVPRGFRPVAADLSAPLEESLPACDAMVITLPPPEGADGYETPLRHLAAALPHRPARTVFVSSTRVFEGYAQQADPAPVLTEEDSPRPLTARARSLLRGEQVAAELARAADAGANVFVAGSAVYGAEDIPAEIATLRELASKHAH